MGSAYLWIKVLHVLAVISWMAAILYLPRLFVYHAGVEKGSAQSELFKVMERRLLRGIMTPAMLVAWPTGLFLAWDAGFLRAGWFHGKLLLVVGLTAAHGLLAASRRAFAEDRNTKSATWYRVFNEVPTLIMIGVVILVIVKPF